MTAGAFQDEMQQVSSSGICYIQAQLHTDASLEPFLKTINVWLQALGAALQLLADVEAQIRSALALDASSSIYDATPEQLQNLPHDVLETLEVGHALYYRWLVCLRCKQAPS